MLNKKIMIKTLLLGLASTLILTSTSTTFSAEKTKLERCSGIAKAGKADGQAIIDGKIVSWILVPAGQCNKLVGGKVLLSKK